MRRLRIAMLTYSLRPRGGVVHALEISEALARRGHEVELIALGPPGERFFREPNVPSRIVRYETIRDAPFDERIMAMCAAYRDGLAEPLSQGGFDLIHAQDCLSANAALELRDAGVFPHLIRTVHHIDDFTSPSLVECQARSILRPDALLCVSEPWVARLANEFGLPAELVSNGVDTDRYRPPRDPAERGRARERFELGDRFTVLTIGGIEPRKGSLTLLEGFARLRELVPDLDALLVVAGGATLFDYRHEIDRFHARVASLGVQESVRVLGSLSDRDIESLYRAADVFAFPSTKEGFGLAALEALASGVPVVATELEEFATYLEHDRSALLVPVGNGDALGDALACVARSRETRARLRAGGLNVAAEYTWDRAAVEHERVYSGLLASLGAVGSGRV
ncbi:MAG TPA: MSMEG_0565 family glycosyltransferase [Solirubrobacteraceae bacterium]|nr:MSMEG_0565 family glycosyltransferase [Solirubrobacteraceae bacterium]